MDNRPESHEWPDSQDFIDNQIRRRLQRDGPLHQHSWVALEELRPRIVAAKRRRQSQQFIATSLAVVALGAAGIAGIGLRSTAQGPVANPVAATGSTGSTGSTASTADNQNATLTDESDLAPPVDEDLETTDDSTDSAPTSRLDSNDATVDTADTTAGGLDDDREGGDDDDSHPPATASTTVLESKCGKVTVSFDGSAAAVTKVKGEDEFTHVINDNGPDRIKVTFRSDERLEEHKDESVDSDRYEICEVGGSVADGRFVSNNPDEHKDEDNE